MDFWTASNFPHMAIVNQQLVVLDYVILVHSQLIDVLHDSLLPSASPSFPHWPQITVGEQKHVYTVQNVNIDALVHERIVSKCACRREETRPHVCRHLTEQQTHNRCSRKTAERPQIWVPKVIKPGFCQTNGCTEEENSLLFSPPLYSTPDPPQVQDYNKSSPPSIHLCSPATVHSCTTVPPT